MRIKALKPFCGTVTMGVGEEKEVPDSTARELITAGYATACVDDRRFDEEILKDNEKDEETENANAPEKTAVKTKAAKK